MSVVQIAAEAGVSIATVSRVLNNSRRVNPQLAAQVRRAMQTLNLDPSQIRRRGPNRRHGSSTRAGTIAIVALGQRYRGWFEIPVMAAVVAEITRAALDESLRTLIAEMPDPMELSPVLKTPLDGALVFIDSSLPPDAAGLLARQLPTVRVMGGQFAPSPIDHVGVDNNGIGYLAARTLIHRGCGELAYLTMRPGWDISRLRSHGFAAAALAAELPCRPFIVDPADRFKDLFGGQSIVATDPRGIVVALADYIRSRPIGAPPLGVFISRDEETVIVYRFMAELGLRPGEHFQVISCDNELVRLSVLDPRPTSIDLNVADIAKHAVARLNARIERRDDPPVRILVNPKLGSPADFHATSIQSTLASPPPPSSTNGTH